MDIPSPYMVHHRSIEIPFVDSSLNGTSFQCFIPSSSGDSLMSSTIGVLTVREKGKCCVLPLQSRSDYAVLQINCLI